MVDGTLVKKYKHPGPVFGCDWSPNNRYVLMDSIFLGFFCHDESIICRSLVIKTVSTGYIEPFQ